MYHQFVYINIAIKWSILFWSILTITIMFCTSLTANLECHLSNILTHAHMHLWWLRNYFATWIWGKKAGATWTRTLCSFGARLSSFVDVHTRKQELCGALVSTLPGFGPEMSWFFAWNFPFSHHFQKFSDMSQFQQAAGCFQQTTTSGTWKIPSTWNTTWQVWISWPLPVDWGGQVVTTATS